MTGKGVWKSFACNSPLLCAKVRSSLQLLAKTEEKGSCSELRLWASIEKSPLLTFLSCIS